MGRIDENVILESDIIKNLRPAHCAWAAEVLATLENIVLVDSFQ